MGDGADDARAAKVCEVCGDRYHVEYGCGRCEMNENLMEAAAEQAEQEARERELELAEMQEPEPDHSDICDEMETR